MRRLFALLLVVAGCGSRVGRYEGDPVGPDMGPMPPEHVMRRNPDFRFIDYSTGKEYILRLYSDENVRMEIVTVRDPGRAERSATPVEKEFAISAFVSDWQSKGLEDKMRYHLEVYENEKKYSATLIDLKMDDEQRALAKFVERRDAMLFNLRARKDSGVVVKEGDELSTKFHEPSNEFLEKELARLEVEIKLGEQRIKTLEYQRNVRNVQFGRSTAALFYREAIQVDDLLKRWTPDGLMTRVKQEIDPDSWLRTQASIHVQDGFLIVAQTRPLITRVRDFVEQLRLEAKRLEKP